MKPIKSVFSAIAPNGNFASNISQHLSKSVVEFINSNLFASGKQCELLRLGTDNWESLFLGIQFTIDAIEDIPKDELYTEKNVESFDSPLDEIRKAAEL